jgi:hypothetical protein
MELLLVATFVGTLTVTSYRAVPEQTDNTPFYTSTGEHVRAGGCAVSRDLLCGACMKLHRRCDNTGNQKKLHYGDWLHVGQYGYRQVNDVMGIYTTQRVKDKVVRIPIRRHIDLFVWTYDQEKSVNVKKIEVFKVNGHTQQRSDPAQFDINKFGTFKGGRQ